ncbi:hypothetical protein ACXPWS_12855 [Mycobacterium sp. BMJ-28]
MAKPDQPNADERRRAALALELRTCGMTYGAVAAQLGYADESGARKAVDRLLSRIEHGGVTELRQLEGQRLDAMQRAVWAQACGGDLDAIKAALAIMGRRAKLYGLDAPQRVALGTDEFNASDFAERAAELIATVSPSTLREMFAAMPGGAFVLKAGAQTTGAEGDSRLQGVSALSEAHSGETATDAADDWANIATPAARQPAPVLKPEPVAQPEPQAVTSTQRRIPVPPELSDTRTMWRRRLGDSV